MNPNQEPVASPFEDDPDDIIDDANEVEQDDEAEELSDDEIIEDDDEEFVDDEFDEDDDEGEEYDDEDDDELSDEEIDDLLAELDDEDDAADGNVDTVPHAALHKEREKRKEMQAALAQQQVMAQEVEAQAEAYADTIASIKKQLKELDLDGVVDIEEPKKKSEKEIAYEQQMQAQQQQEAITRSVAEIKQEAAAMLPEFPLIDGQSKEHEEIVLGLSIAAMFFGSDPEDAAESAMKTLNGALSAKEKARILKRQPVKRATRASRSVKRKSRPSPRVKAGNTKAFFDQMANDAFS